MGPRIELSIRDTQVPSSLTSEAEAVAATASPDFLAGMSCARGEESTGHVNSPPTELGVQVVTKQDTPAERGCCGTCGRASPAFAYTAAAVAASSEEEVEEALRLR